MVSIAAENSEISHLMRLCGCYGNNQEVVKYIEGESKVPADNINVFIQQTYLFRLKVSSKEEWEKCLFERFQPLPVFFKGTHKQNQNLHLHFLCWFKVRPVMNVMNKES